MTKAYVYYYILTEDGSQIGKILEGAITNFKDIHKDDAKVHIITRQSDYEGFEKIRRKFDVRRIPAIVISDHDKPGPFIGLDRGILERYIVRQYNNSLIDENASRDSLYNLIADFHYIVQDEDLLHLKHKLTTEKVLSFLRTTWDEVKDLISINVSP